MISEEIKYREAQKQVKRMKGFYIHAIVYVVINGMLLVEHFQDLDAGESFWELKNFSTLLFWGVGLLAHGLSVFAPTFILGKDWEEKKIQEFMGKEKEAQNKWQ